MKSFVIRTLFIFIGLMQLAHGRSEPLPASLNDWKDWVLYPNDQRSCLTTDAPTPEPNNSEKLCAWPGELAIEARANEVSFSQHWRVYADSWIPLPGNATNWPTSVSMNSHPLVITERNGLPFIRLLPGDYQLEGSIPWQKVAQTLQIPPETGMVALTIDGQRIVNPQRTGNGDIWLAQQNSPDTAAQTKHLELRVYRQIKDGNPVTTTTRIELDIAGPNREEILGIALPKQQHLTNIESPLPAKLDSNGVLTIQTRPGQWQIELESRLDNNVTELSLETNNAPWPKEEYWSFAANSAYRVVDVSGGNAVDPKQVGIPADWVHLPAFHLAPKEKLVFAERQRGMAIAQTAKLSLNRDLWLDFDGGGFTARDQINGTFNRDARLNTDPALPLQQASVNSQPQLITSDPTTHDTGIEIRESNVSINAISRAKDSRELPVSGWSNDMDNVSASLHLPPGYTLLAAPGADSAPEAWLSKWSLLDFFLLLIAVALTKQRIGWGWALIAGLGIGICFQDMDAPKGLWINWLAASLALTALPDGKLRNWVTRYQHLSLLAVIVIALPFIAEQAKLIIHPQLERYAMSQSADNFGQARAPANMPASAPAAMMKQSIEGGIVAMEDRMESMAAPEQKKREIPITVFDPNATVQVGPGIPNWEWNTFTLQWNSPVTAKQTVKLWIVSDAAHRVWRLLMIVFIVAFFAKLLRLGYKPDALKSLIPSNPAVAIVLLAIFTAAPHRPAQASDFPPPELLEQLKQRLLAPEPCEPNCATITKAAITADSKRITIELEAHAETTTVLALPTQLHQWQPDTLSIDDNTNPPFQYRNQIGYIAIDRGIHRITLSGATPAENKITITFPSRPHWVTTQLTDLEITGIDNGHLLSDGIELTRTQLNQGEQLDTSKQEIPAFVTVHRYLTIDIDWRIRTVIERNAPKIGAIAVSIPLIPGESIITDGFEVKDGHVTASLASNVQHVEWSSVLGKSNSITLTAPESPNWTESWHLQTTANWHTSHSGVAPISWQQENRLETEFAPWPKEKLTIKVAKPEAIPGDSIAIDRVNLNVQLGQRTSNNDMTFHARASRATQQKITLPDAAVIEQIQIDNEPQPVPKKGEPVVLSFTPGEHEAKLTWREDKSGFSIKTNTAAIDLGTAAANIAITATIPNDRWLLWTQGPRLGPAILYWGELAVLIVLAFGLSRLRNLPLKPVEWILLGLGVSLTAGPLLLLVAGSFIALDIYRLRSEQIPAKWKKPTQILLGLLCIGALLSVVAVIPISLLGEPAMHVVGNGSYAGVLNWFVDRSSGEIPSVSIYSLPVFAYQVAMLAWSVWIAFALLRWIRWGWRCLTPANEQP